MARHCEKRSSHRVRLRKGESPAESRSLKKKLPQLLIGQGQKSFSISHSWLWASYGSKERPAEGLWDLCVSQQRLCCTAGPENHMISWNGDFCIENEDRNHMIWWKGDNEGEDQTCSLCRWDQAPWKCGQAVREQSLPGEQSPWNRQYHNYGQLSIGCLQSEVPPEVLPGSVVGHSCWTFGSDYLHSWKYTVLIFSFKLSGQSDIWRNISAAITYQYALVSSKSCSPFAWNW